jgi:uncharacterized membrane protein YphA (DoxX/SURF4 family)
MAAAAPQRVGIDPLRIGIAAVWLVFGVGFKLLGLVPRHRMIVARILGDGLATPATIAIGLAETTLGLWVLSGWKPRACAAAQTVAIVTMNAIELTVARDLLLAPVLMVCANAVLLALAWWSALRTAAAPRAA